MDIAVLISGVADPKWPLPPDLSVDSLQSHCARYAALSPFDEAALELALKLRDADATVRVIALVAAHESLTRKVAGWRPDAIHQLDLAAVASWDGGSVAVVLAQALRQLAPDACVMLIGREFGDLDDGTVPAALAQEMETIDLSLVLGLCRSSSGELLATRQADGGLHRARLPARAVLCATNDSSNRLRHPLMKNVMAAKKAVLPTWRPSEPTPHSTLELQSLAPAKPPVRNSACEWLDGTAEEKAQALARILLAARA